LLKLCGNTGGLDQGDDDDEAAHDEEGGHGGASVVRNRVQRGR
jgi:hypothetical protein